MAEWESGSDAFVDSARGWRRVKWRYRLAFIALFFAVVIYTYVVDIYDPNKSILSQLVPGRQSYELYSGDTGGFYEVIGETLHEVTREGDESITLNNTKTRGGEENTRKVLQSNNAFGLAHEDTLQDKDFIRDHIRFITPLYVERFHVIYDHDAYRRFIEEWQENHSSSSVVDSSQPPNPGPPPESPSLKTNTHPAVKAFFEDSPISTGPPGSGTRVIARYLLDFCRISPTEDKGIGFSDALDKLGSKDSDKRIDVVFTIAGAPLLKVHDKLVSEVLDKIDSEEHEKLDSRERDKLDSPKPRFQLMSVDSSMVPMLNKDYGLKLRQSSFKNKYPDGDSVSTFGSYAFLIASERVPNAAILSLLEILEKNKEIVKKNAKLESIEDFQKDQFQLEEFPFYEAFRQEHEHSTFEVLRVWAIAFVTIVITTFAILIFFGRIASGFHRARFVQRITQTYKDSMPQNFNLNRNDQPFPIPIIFQHQIEIIHNLVAGCSELLHIANDVRLAYEDGKIVTQHSQHILDTIQSLQGEFQQNLSRRLHEHLAAGRELDERTIRSFFTAGYISQEDFEFLQGHASRVRHRAAFHPRNDSFEVNGGASMDNSVVNAADRSLWPQQDEPNDGFHDDEWTAMLAKSLKELREIAKTLKVRGRTRMSKSQLIEAILNASKGNEDPSGDLVSS